MLHLIGVYWSSSCCYFEGGEKKCFMVGGRWHPGGPPFHDTLLPPKYCFFFKPKMLFIEVLVADCNFFLKAWAMLSYSYSSLMSSFCWVFLLNLRCGLLLKGWFRDLSGPSPLVKGCPKKVTNMIFTPPPRTKFN